MSDNIKDRDTGRKNRIKRADIQGQYGSEPSLIKSFQIHAVSCDDASGVKVAVPRNFATTSWKHGGHANYMTYMGTMEENDMFKRFSCFNFFCRSACTLSSAVCRSSAAVTCSVFAAKTTTTKPVPGKNIE